MSMYWEDTGSGPAVMVLHGAPSAISDFGPLAAALRSNHRVLIPELPGYGRSAALTGEHSFARLYALVEEELLARGVTELAIVGFSLGALHALALAGSRRLRATRVVLLGGFAALDEAGRSARHQLAALVRQPGFALSAPELQALIRDSSFCPSCRTAPAAAACVSAALAVASPDVLAADWTAAADADVRSSLPRLEIPVTAIVGEHDETTPVAFSEEIVRACRRGQLEIIPGHGHAVFVEDPERTVAAVLDALRR